MFFFNVLVVVNARAAASELAARTAGADAAPLVTTAFPAVTLAVVKIAARWRVKKRIYFNLLFHRRKGKGRGKVVRW